MGQPYPGGIPSMAWCRVRKLRPVPPASGAYVLSDCATGSPTVILIASGSEVSVALEAHNQLTREGIASRIVSMASWDLFQLQPQSYRDTVLPPGVKARVSIEAGSTLGWERYVGLDGAIIGLDRFGGSAPGEIVMRELGSPRNTLSKLPNP
jgi:transketolase